MKLGTTQTIIRKTVTAALVGFCLLAGSAPAQTVQPPAPPAFVSGGIGDEDRAALEATEKSYSFKAVMAGEGGVFLDDVQVTITDAANNTILTTDTEGPILLVQLLPGKYHITAQVQGLTQSHKVTIRKNRHTSITIRFPLSE